MSEINLNGGSKKIILNGTTYYAGGSNSGGGSSTLITKTITQNGTYSAQDDNADGYSEVNVNVQGKITYESLCFATYVGNDTEEIPTMQELTESFHFGDYLSYSSSTGKFTVLQDFDAFILPYVFQYLTPSGSYANGAFYINDTLVIDFAVAYRRYGVKAGYPVITQLHQGDTFYSYTPASDGYPQQMLKVYRMIGANQSDIETLQSMLTMVDPPEDDE